MVDMSSESDREMIRLWRAWKTVHEMCRDRGYELTDEEITISLDEFSRLYGTNGFPDRGKMTFTARPSDEMIKKFSVPPSHRDYHKPIPCGTVYVEFQKDSSIGIKQMRAFAQTISQQQYHTGIMITQASITPAAYKVVPAVLPSIIETFQEQDLLVNLTHHELVPKHILLSEEEKQALLKRYRLKETQLPRIQVSDPVARYLGLRRGNVVKIIRKSETAGRYASYRWTI